MLKNRRVRSTSPVGRVRATADAVVIGAGIVGTSIGRELALLGLRTLVLDRNQDAGLGSTSSSGGVIHCFYGTKQSAALAWEARKVFERWAEHLEVPQPRARFHHVGAALLWPEGEARACEALARRMQSVGASAETLTGREAQSLVPGMRGVRVRVLFEAGGGYVAEARDAALDMRASGEALGARYLFGEPVVEVRSRPLGRNGARRITGVSCASGLRIDAPVVINAAGPHSAQVNLLARAPAPLTTVPLVQRIVVGRTNSPDNLPVVADLPGGQYVRFDRGRFFLGDMNPYQTRRFQADAESTPRVPKAFVPEQSRAFHRRYPRLRWQEARAHATLVDLTVLDGHPIVDKSDVQGYYMAIGSSGRWFAGGPTLGWLLARLVVAVESGVDSDVKPLQVRLPCSGLPFDLQFLSRSRKAIPSELPRVILG